jgi:inosine/xanthosine triphosphate pyrophosphatase family protein
MKQVFFATENQSKVKRFKDGLFKNHIEMITIQDIDSKIDIEENGKDAVENALIKARAYSKIIDIPVLAMDDSLFIEGIPSNLQPGMYVRRVNGKRLQDDEMIEYYSHLANVYGKNGKLTCKWVYGIAIVHNGREVTYSWSKEDFYIVDRPSLKINPGYPLNTISVNKKLNKYFTDITEEDRFNLEEDESHVIEFISKNV